MDEWWLMECTWFDNQERLLRLLVIQIAGSRIELGAVIGRFIFIKNFWFKQTCVVILHSI